jgi:mono/diheme cytochrome c family protein
MMRLSVLAKILVVLAIVGAAAFYVLTMPSRAVTGDLPAHTANLANGETMFNAGGCASCHTTTGQDDSHRLGGGLSLVTQFGTFKVPNISPAPEHGIGRWSEADFINAVLRGVGKNGEHLYPAFPYTSYAHMKLDDVRDLYAFMKTLPADTAPSAPHQLGFPFNVRRGIGLWKVAFLDTKVFTPEPARDAALNRGAYLVEGPGHCAECHSPRNVFGGIITADRFSGGPDPSGKFWIPNITPHADGLAKWSVKDIEFLLETGFKPNMDTVGSGMGEVVQNISKLSAEDRTAMATYIKALPPRPGKPPPKSK